MDAHVEKSLDALRRHAETYPSWALTFSGGKDSMTTLSFVLWAIETGKVKKPARFAVLHSDTGQEFPDVEANAQKALAAVRRLGFEAVTVQPSPTNRFWVVVLGRGVPPVHPGMKGRWCTRALKVDPMLGVMESLVPEGGGKLLVLTGVRFGESDSRDTKLEDSQTRSLPVLSCSSGGECGLGVWLDRTISDIYDPLPLIVHWKECQVYDWLQGLDPRYHHPLPEEARAVYRLYKPAEINDDVVESMRFGCVGCPAVSRDKVLDRYAETNAGYAVLRQLYHVWREMRSPWWRLWKPGEAKKRDGGGQKKRRRKRHFTGRLGPLTLAARRYFFRHVLEIQRRAGVELLTPGDAEQIRKCWDNRVFPRGWTGGEREARTVAYPLLNGLE